MQWPAAEPGEGRIVGGRRGVWWRSPEPPAREERQPSHLLLRLLHLIPPHDVGGGDGEPVLAVSD